MKINIMILYIGYYMINYVFKMLFIDCDKEVWKLSFRFRYEVKFKREEIFERYFFCVKGK